MSDFALPMSPLWFWNKPTVVNFNQLKKTPSLRAKRDNERANGSPGIGTVTVENEMDLSPEILNFHLWFFREKGWIQREEDGGLSITAEGVERAEANKYRASNNLARIEAQPQSVPMPSMHVGQTNATIAIHAG